MDVINSKFDYLGSALITPQALTPASFPGLSDGGNYGASWRISGGTYGQNIATGWIENSTFANNHFGAYTFGASGMTWRGSVFESNEIYGLDPHDDSNNALIEDNTFRHNGKHGFIVSKRCNYNIIRNNVSYSNKLHGFMLHEQSDYNLVENNTAYDNYDNFVVYHGEYNTIRNNTSYSPFANHVRINEKSRNNYVINNKMYGGRRAIYVYGNSANLYVNQNVIQGTRDVLTTIGAQNVLFSNNTVDHLAYKVQQGDRLVFGPNSLQHDKLIPTAPKDIAER
jgi:parallel beta-helix repeat protein